MEAERDSFPLEMHCQWVQPEELKSGSPSGLALGPSRQQNLDREPYLR